MAKAARPCAADTDGEGLPLSHFNSGRPVRGSGVRRPPWPCAASAGPCGVGRRLRGPSGSSAALSDGLEGARLRLEVGALVVGVHLGVGRVEHGLIEALWRRADTLVGEGPHQAASLRLDLVGEAADPVLNGALGRRQREGHARIRLALRALLGAQPCPRSSTPRRRSRRAE